jgi:CAAX prenyl protease-like protein
MPFAKPRWVVFLLPFAVYTLLGALEPASEGSTAAWLGLPIPYATYPLFYLLKIALTVVAIAWVWPGYRQFPLQLSPWALLIGGVGVVVWIVLCSLERWFGQAFSLGWLASLGGRAAYDPFTQLADHPALAWGFLAVRFLGLAAVVPLIEESFLRGFLLRYVVAPRWWDVPFGKLTPLAVVVAVGVPVLYHPATEMLAVAVWFGMVTWLMAKTRNFWDCVAAHALTNLLLGIYVVAFGQWWLW